MVSAFGYSSFIMHHVLLQLIALRSTSHCSARLRTVQFRTISVIGRDSRYTFAAIAIPEAASQDSLIISVDAAALRLAILTASVVFISTRTLVYISKCPQRSDHTRSRLCSMHNGVGSLQSEIDWKHRACGDSHISSVALFTSLSFSHVFSKLLRHL